MARATRAIIPTSPIFRVFPGRTNAATATARPSRPYLTARVTRSATLNIGAGVGFGLESMVYTCLGRNFKQGGVHIQQLHKTPTHGRRQLQERCGPRRTREAEREESSREHRETAERTQRQGREQMPFC